jgi:hypothetical protein
MVSNPIQTRAQDQLQETMTLTPTLMTAPKIFWQILKLVDKEESLEIWFQTLLRYTALIKINLPYSYLSSQNH